MHREPLPRPLRNCSQPLGSCERCALRIPCRELFCSLIITFPSGRVSWFVNHSKPKTGIGKQPNAPELPAECSRAVQEGFQQHWRGTKSARSPKGPPFLQESKRRERSQRGHLLEGHCWVIVSHSQSLQEEEDLKPRPPKKLWKDWEIHSRGGGPWGILNAGCGGDSQG